MRRESERGKSNQCNNELIKEANRPPPAPGAAIWSWPAARRQPIERGGSRRRREPLTFQPGVTMSSAAAAAAVVLISQNSTEATIAIPSKVRGPSSAAARCGLLAVERLPCVLGRGSRGSRGSNFRGTDRPQDHTSSSIPGDSRHEMAEVCKSSRAGEKAEGRVRTRRQLVGLVAAQGAQHSHRGWSVQTAAQEHYSAQ
jgi:hypothetical protein